MYIQSRALIRPEGLNGLYLAGFRRENRAMHPEPADAGHITEAASDSARADQAAGVDAAHSGDATPAKRTRSRDGKNIIFRVFPEEHDDIAARAAEAGLTVSEFIRRIAMGYKTQSRFDYDVIEYLISMHTDMNRLGNLFKLSLKQGDGADGVTDPPLSERAREWHRSILKSIEENQELLRNYIGGFNA